MRAHPYHLREQHGQRIRRRGASNGRQDEESSAGIGCYDGNHLCLARECCCHGNHFLRAINSNAKAWIRPVGYVTSNILCLILLQNTTSSVIGCFYVTHLLVTMLLLCYAQPIQVFHPCLCELWEIPENLAICSGFLCHSSQQQCLLTRLTFGKRAFTDFMTQVSQHWIVTTLPNCISMNGEKYTKNEDSLTSHWAKCSSKHLW